MFDENDWDPYDGFNRASIVMRSRKPYRPNIRAEDLLTPSGLGNARMAGMCVVMAICLVLLYIWPVLFVVNLAAPMDGRLFGSILGVIALRSSSSSTSREPVRRAETASSPPSCSSSPARRP